MPPPPAPLPRERGARAQRGRGEGNATECAGLTSAYDYDLPEELIAQHPSEVRDRSRLLVLDPRTGAMQHRVFSELPDLLQPGDCLVLNDTRVLPARLLGATAGGGRVEVLLLAPVAGDEWECLAKPGRRCPPGRVLRFGEGPWIEVEVLERIDDTGRRRVRLRASTELNQALEAIGHVPLPPYIRRPDEAADRERYQTVYAAHPGSVAAPTAGLHFTPELIARIEAVGVRIVRLTLHVGLGTFRPISVERLAEHHMHSERYSVSDECAATVNGCRAAGGRVVAVGTTSVRVLEAIADEVGQLTPGSGETSLFIRPGHGLRAVDALVTNFHLPRSSLLVLVSAFAGRERVLEAYGEAVKLRYRFYSYGDAMALISPAA